MVRRIREKIRKRTLGQSPLQMIIAVATLAIIAVVVIQIIVTFGIGMTVDEALATLRANGYEAYTTSEGDLYTNNIYPNLDNTYDLGSADLQWKELYVASGSIHLGDVLLEDEGGCLAVPDLHVHGVLGIAGYVKLAFGTAPPHNEAGHGMLWMDSNEKLYLQKPVSFDAKADGSHHLGFIAEDMQDIDYRLATGDYLPGLDINAIVATLTALVQELEERVEALEDEAQ